MPMHVSNVKAEQTTTKEKTKKSKK